MSIKELETATSCVRDHDATTVPARHTWETETLHWARFTLQRFIRFLEFAEFTKFAEFKESCTAFRKNSTVVVSNGWFEVTFGFWHTRLRDSMICTFVESRQWETMTLGIWTQRYLVHQMFTQDLLMLQVGHG